MTRERKTIDRFLKKCINQDSSYVDVGALWGTKNETVSRARSLGAKKVSIIDIQEFSNSLWENMDHHLLDLGVDCDYISGDVRDLHNEYNVKFDVVFCAGIIYHEASPLDLISNLANMTSRYLILGSMVCPPEIKNNKGKLSLDCIGAAFIPYLFPKDSEIILEHFRTQGVPEIPSLESNFNWPDIKDTTPWWWIFTPKYLEKLVEISGFKVLDKGSDWGNNDHFLLCEKIKSNS